MSISLKVVSMAQLFCASFKRRAIVCRMRVILTRASVRPGGVASEADTERTSAACEGLGGTGGGDFGMDPCSAGLEGAGAAGAAFFGASSFFAAFGASSVFAAGFGASAFFAGAAVGFRMMSIIRYQLTNDQIWT